MIKNFLTKKQTWIELGAEVLDFAIPNCCIYCEKETEKGSFPALCDSCRDVFWNEYRCKRCHHKCHQHELTKSRCSYCKHIHYPFNSFEALGPYKNWLRKAILLYKFKHDLLALKYLQSITDKFKIPHLEGKTIISYISSHKLRLKERRFKEQHLIHMLKPLAKKLNLPIEASLIKNTFSEAQIDLSGDARRNSMEGTLTWCYKGDKTPETVLLFDDVWTTGSTMKEACRVIKDAGVKTIHCKTFAVHPKFAVN